MSEQFYTYERLKSRLTLGDKTMEELWNGGMFGEDRYKFTGFMIGVTEMLELIGQGDQGVYDIDEPISSTELELATTFPVYMFGLWDEKILLEKVEYHTLHKDIATVIARYGEAYRDMIEDGDTDPNENITG